MPRRASIWLRKQTGWYCVTFRGEIRKLSKDKAEAERLFHELMAKKDEEPAPKAKSLPLAVLAETYLTATRTNRTPETDAARSKHLRRFVAFVGDLEAADARPHHVTSWLQSKPKWGPSTHSFMRKLVKTLFNWATREGHLESNPLAKMPLGKIGRRERTLTVEQRRRILQDVPANLADFLFVLERTGCRPFSELAKLTAADLDLEAGVAVIQQHKNRKKVGKPRTIYLVPEVVAVLKRLAVRGPTDPLFRNVAGKPLERSNVQQILARFTRRTGIAASAYDYRHTFITEALIRGVPVEVVAELVGNSPAVIHRHYAHVAKDKDALRAAAAKAVGATPPTTAST